MLPLIFATLFVIGPDGWRESPDQLSHADGIEAKVFMPPDRDTAAYVVLRVGFEPSRVIAHTLETLGADHGTEVSRNTRYGDGYSIEDVVLSQPDGSSTHIRTLIGTRPEALVGICHGKDADFQACESKLSLLNVQVDKYEIGHFKTILLWVVLGLLAIGAIGGIAIRILQKRRLATSAKLTEGEQVTISGVVRSLGTVLEAPLSGRRCVSHRSRARIVEGDRLVAEPSETAVTPFVVETRHGSVRIEVDELVHEAPPEVVVDLGSERQRAFRERHAASRGSAAYSEVLIEPGVNVSIKGIVAFERDPSAADERGYRDEAPTTIKLVARPSQPVTVLKIW